MVNAPPPPASPSPHLHRPPGENLVAPAMWILAAIGMGLVLKTAKPVLVPLVLAWLFSYVLTPPVRFLNTRLRIPNGLSVFVVLASIFLLFWGAGVVVQQRLLAFAKAFPVYYDKILVFLESIAVSWDLPSDAIRDFDVSQFLGPLLRQSSRFFANFIYLAILITVFLIFMLIGKPYSRAKLQAAMPRRAAVIGEVLDKISIQIGAYIGSLFLISIITGVAVWGALAFLKVEFAFTWGLLAFTLNFIPTIGSIVASIPPILIVLVQHDSSPWDVLLTAIVIAVIQFGIGNGIAPKIYGDRLNLSPVTILIFLLLGTWLWGVPGTLLSVPMAAALQIALAHIPVLSPISVLMGNGKHLTPRKRSRRRKHRGSGLNVYMEKKKEASVGVVEE